MDEFSRIGVDLGKGCFSGAWLAGRRRLGGEPQIEPFEGAPVFRSDPALSDRHGGLRLGSLLGAKSWPAMGREVVLRPPANIKPYVKRGKNDAVDAAVDRRGHVAPRYAVRAG